MTSEPEKLLPGIARLRVLAEEAGRELPEVIAFAGLDPGRPDMLRERIEALAELGVFRVVIGTRYADADEFSRQVDTVAERVLPGLPGMRASAAGREG
jgi:hypothetical protein